MSASKRLRTPLIVMFGLIMAMVTFAAPANAYPGGTQPAVSVSTGTPAAGSSLKFCGTGFQPGETVTITLDNGTTYPSAVADSSGGFCTTVVLGATLTGAHTLTATGATSGSTSSAAIQVLGASASGVPPTTAVPPTTSGLAFTGAAVIGIGGLGGLLLLSGALMVLASRRRKINA